MRFFTMSKSQDHSARTIRLSQVFSFAHHRIKFAALEIAHAVRSGFMGLSWPVGKNARLSVDNEFDHSDFPGLR